MNIKNNFSQDIAKKILGNIDLKIEYLLKLNQLKKLNLNFKKITRGKNKGLMKLNYTNNEINELVVDTWDYNISKNIIREIFTYNGKYKRGKEAHEVMNVLIEEWNKLSLGQIEWPFSQGAFDEFVQRINSINNTGDEKDIEVKSAAVKFRRLKEINTVRNDFLETLIFEKNTNILPTLNHRRGVDFFIDGESFDQKVAKSPTKEFKKDFGENWKQEALNKPEKVAEYLYKYQDEGRFGADSRLLIVYLDEKVSIDEIQKKIEETDLENPLEINFTFNHRNEGEKRYKVKCFVILLCEEEK